MTRKLICAVAAAGVTLAAFTAGASAQTYIYPGDTAIQAYDSPGPYYSPYSSGYADDAYAAGPGVVAVDPGPSAVVIGPGVTTGYAPGYNRWRRDRVNHLPER